MMLIMIALTTSVLLYVYSVGVLGNFETPAQQNVDNLRIEAYNWHSLTSLTLNVRNIASDVVNIGSADWFVGGIKQATVSGCTGTLAPGASCAEQITISGLTTSAGIVYVVRIVLADGSFFASSATAGQVTGQTGIT
jgi:hypothetical protein